MHALLGPFRILARLGAGGMGQAWLGERVAVEWNGSPAAAPPVRTPGAVPSGASAASTLAWGGDRQRVCVKRILDEEATNPEWIERFEREGRLLTMLRHQNLVGLIELGLAAETRWMALELVEGTDLRDLLRGLREHGQRLPLDVAVFIVAEVAVALSVAHDARGEGGEPLGLVHRDVTPTNILVSHRGEVKLTDFGIAKVTKSARTRTGQLAGKVPYMSPEHSLERDLDHRSDLFTLGVVLFELLAGERPFEGRTWLETRVHVAEGKRKQLRPLVPDAPAALVELVDGMLEIEPEKRTPSAYEVISALRLMTEPYAAARHLGKLVTWCKPPWTVPPEGVLTEDEVRVVERRA